MPVTTRASYLDYVAMFDQLTDDRVIWTPSTTERVHNRASHGLSSQCARDSAYWLTRSYLVYNMYVEAYSVYRVMRQFGL